MESRYTMNQPVTISHDKAIIIIARHGWTPTDQTATFNGEWVESDSSFYEMLGTHHAYSLRTVKDWLGY
jgi:hypothetical protein